MAKEWWEQAPIAQEKPHEWWQSAPLAKQEQPSEDEWWKSAPIAQQKPGSQESGGFLDTAASALKERVESFLPAAKLYTGLGDQKQATADILKSQKEADEAFKQTEFSDIGKEFKAGNYGEALGKSLDKFKEVAGSSLGSMAPAIAAGQAGTMVAGPLGGIAAFTLTTLGSYIADNVGRQKQEQEKVGKASEEVNSLSATVAAAGQTALDLVGFKMFKPLGALVGLEGKGLAQKTAEEIVQAATNPKAYRNAVAKGIAQGIAFEIPQEVAQQVLERWQAGLPLDPFSDPEAAKEYLEAAGGALMLGGPLGATSNVMQTRAIRQQAKQDQNAQTIQNLVEPQAEQPAQTPEQPAPKEPQVVSEEIATIAKNLQESGNHTPEDAQAIAIRIVEEANKTPQPPPVLASGELNPELVTTIAKQIETKNTSEGWGLTPQEIQADALALATKEAQEAKQQQMAEATPVQVEPQGEANVGQPVSPPVGTSNEIPSAADQGVAPAGVGEAERDGVVSPEPNAGQPVVGEAEQPAPIAENPVDETPTPTEVITEEKAPVEELTPEQIAEEFATQAEETKPEPAKKAPAIPKGERKTKDRANIKEVEDVEKQLAEASKPFDEGVAENDEKLEEGRRAHKLEKLQAIKAILELRDKMKTASPEVKARLTTLLNSPSISQQEYNNVKQGIELQRKYSAQLKAAEAPANTAFNKAKNGAQAIAQIVKTGNAFEKLLAKHILRFVKDVKFVVVEKGNEPDALKTPKGKKFWQNASGLFVQNDATGARTVYVAGESYGNLQGINNITVLHELLHAATNQKLYLGLKALENKFSRDAALTKATKDLQDIMHNVQDYFIEQYNAGKLPPEMLEIYKNTNGTVLTDLREFLAYGMSDPDFQAFMMNVQGIEEDVSFFSHFVTAIREFFQMGENTTNALTDLIVATDRLLTSKKTADMRLLEAGDKALAQREGGEKISQQVKKTKEAQDKNLKKLETSSAADALKDGTIADLVKLRNNTELVDTLSAHTDAMKHGALRELLPSLMTDTLTKWAQKLGINGIMESWERVNDLEASRTRRNKAMDNIATRLGGLQAKNVDMYKKLANAMHYSTLVEIDPTTKHTNTAITRMWEGLDADAKKLYTDVRDFYRDNYELYYAALEEQINNMGLAPQDKQKVMAGIRQMYEDGKKIQPYFPLMRYGQYWARIGKGANSEFHMFESITDREVFLTQRARQAGKTKGDMIASEDVDVGNNLNEAKKGETSAMIKNIFESINAGTKGIVDDFGNVAGGTINVDKFKDEVYQMFLQSLPERSFRKKFLHRQGKAGFSSDIHRNFVTTGSSMINQVARVKYGPEILRELDRAKEILKGNPDKAKLSEFVSEMRMRVDMELNPKAEQDSAAETASRFLTTTAFLWMMSSVKTAVAQFSSIPVFVAPVLASKHGVASTAKAMGKWLNVFNGFGIKDAQGNFSAPTIGNLKGLTDDQKKAVQYMKDRNISETTMAMDIAGRRSVSTTAYQSKTRKIARGAADVLTGLFHHSERMIREVAFMSAYDLNRKKMGHEPALLRAEKEVHEALNNYHKGNRPRGIGQDAAGKVRFDANAPLGRAVLQFKMFPAFVTTYFIRNAWRMTKDMDPQARKEARVQFLGSLAMSMTIAGVMGVPGFSFALGIIQGLLDLFRGEDDEDPLDERDLELWFRNKWLPQTFGGVKIGGHSLAELLDRGVVASLTGYDITSSLSMNNMWFPDIKEAATAQAQMQDYLMSLAGPGASLAFKQVPTAIDFFHKGEILRGMEQLMPALIRAPMTAARYAKEGAQTSSGAVIKEADEFTTGQIMAQSLGFATEGLQAKREEIFKVQGQIIKAKQEKATTIARLEKELIKGSDSDVETAFEKVFAYNSKNWFDPISRDTITEAMKRRMKQRFDRGFPMDKKYYPQVAELLEPGSEKLDREAKK